MNTTYYFDYNSTAPLANSLKDYLAKGVFFEANASSVHFQGKKSQKLIEHTQKFIQNHYQLKDHQLVFTSGATEGMNWAVKSFVHQNIVHKLKFNFICFATDHSVALQQKEYIESLGGKFICLPVLNSGQVDKSLLDKTLAELQGEPTLVNWTWVNNETGVVWNLKEIASLKKKYDFLVHIDAAQTPFKIFDYNIIDHELDFYSFSGHKFGALKGVGFSFIKESSQQNPLMLGGSQQKLRSGTINNLGIYSMELALKEAMNAFNPEESLKAITYLRKKLSSMGTIFGADPLNLNTISLALPKTKTQVSLIKFDLAQIAISSGSACTSGNLQPSHVISAMGFTNLADHMLRFSFETDLTLEKAEKYYLLIAAVVAELEG